MKLYERCAYGIDLAVRLNFVWTLNLHMRGGPWMKSCEKCEYRIDLAQRLNFMWIKNGLG